jgi:hypothetical protein
MAAAGVGLATRRLHFRASGPAGVNIAVGADHSRAAASTGNLVAARAGVFSGLAAMYDSTAAWALVDVPLARTTSARHGRRGALTD